jgi:cell division topological specificity factor
MWQGFKSWFVGKPSSEVAKGRLHLVLAHDRTGLDGGRLQELRQEIAAVLSKYVPIDVNAVEIQIETHKRATQLKMSTSIQPRNV